MNQSRSGPTRTEAMQRLGHASKAFHKALAALYAEHDLGDAEVENAQQRLKEAAVARKDGDLATIEKLADELEVETAAFNTRIEEPETQDESFGVEQEEVAGGFGMPAPVPFYSDTANYGGPEELTESQREELAQNYQVVSAMLAGLSPKDALALHGVDRTRRWARKMRLCYETDGLKGLYDRRWNNGRGNQGKVSGEIRDRLMSLYYEFPAAGPKLLWKKLNKELSQLVSAESLKSLDLPGYSTVKRYLSNLPETFKVVRHGGLPAYDRRAQPVFAGEITRFANERWQADHTELPLWIRVWRDDHWVASRVWLSVALDAHSRAIAGFVLQDSYPNSWTVAKLLMRSVQPKSVPEWTVQGVPTVFQTDMGGDFISHNVVSSLGMLGVIHDVDPGYYPERKGRVERFFETLNTSCLKGLHGHKAAIGKSEGAARKNVHALLTLDQLEKEISRWIVTDYHVSTNEETGRKPIHEWEETVRLLKPASEDVFRVLLLQSDKTRVVRRTGIDFMRTTTGGRYWAPELTWHYRREVRIRYHPDEHESILVFCAVTGEYLCEAWKWKGENSQNTVQDVKKARSRYRRGLRARLEMYSKEETEEEREIRNANEWQEARETAEKEQRGAIEEDKIEEADEMDELVNELKKRYRTA